MNLFNSFFLGIDLLPINDSWKVYRSNRKVPVHNLKHPAVGCRQPTRNRRSTAVDEYLSRICRWTSNGDA